MDTTVTLYDAHVITRSTDKDGEFWAPVPQRAYKITIRGKRVELEMSRDGLWRKYLSIDSVEIL